MSFKHVRNTYFLINAIKKYVFFTYKGTHINLICELYEIIYASHVPRDTYQFYM
jgi:hypothetical protein